VVRLRFQVLSHHKNQWIVSQDVAACRGVHSDYEKETRSGWAESCLEDAGQYTVAVVD
jgi:hypothetical protein